MFSFFRSEIEEEDGCSEDGCSEIQRKVEDLIKVLAQIHRDDVGTLETLCDLAHRCSFSCLMFPNMGNITKKESGNRVQTKQMNFGDCLKMSEGCTHSHG